MKPLLLIITILLASCVSTELPTAATMETGDAVNTPRQYKEFCRRDENDLCPKDRDANLNN